MVSNDWFLQFLADILDTPVERPANVESTVLGAAYLASYGAGILVDVEQISASWRCEARFDPQMSSSRRSQLLEGWRTAVSRIQSREQ